MGNQVNKHWLIGLFAGLILCLYSGCTGTSSQIDEAEKKDVPSESTCQKKPFYRMASRPWEIHPIILFKSKLILAAYP